MVKFFQPPTKAPNLQQKCSSVVLTVMVDLIFKYDALSGEAKARGPAENIISCQWYFLGEFYWVDAQANDLKSSSNNKEQASDSWHKEDWRLCKWGH